MLNQNEIKQLSIRIRIGVTYIHFVPHTDYEPRTATSEPRGSFEIYIGGAVIAFSVLRKVRWDHAFDMLEAAKLAYFDRAPDAYAWVRSAAKILRRGGTKESAIALMS